jgi:hypothetical protein
MAVIGRVMAVDMTREALIRTGIVMTMTMVTLLIDEVRSPECGMAFDFVRHKDIRIMRDDVKWWRAANCYGQHQSDYRARPLNELSEHLR